MDVARTRRRAFAASVAAGARRQRANELKAVGPSGIWGRVWNSAVVWAWTFNGLRLASVIVIMPLLLLLPEADLGFYYLLLNVLAITPLIDFGFPVSVDRAVSYAMGGAKELTAHGLPPQGSTPGRPNFELLWKLVYTTQLFYRGLTLVLLVVLGSVGTYILSRAVDETANPKVAWLAWAIALLNAVFEVYTGWWNVFLRGTNRVVASSRILCLGYGVKLVLACILLLSGAGLVAIFSAGLVGSALVRALSRRSCLRLLPPAGPRPEMPELISIIRILWPNTWRVGVQLLGNYLTALGISLLCFKMFRLKGNGQYGLSLQAATIIAAMASVWVTVKWPLIGQMRAKLDQLAMRQLLWSRMWLFIATYALLAFLALLAGPFLLKLSGTGKEILPPPWFALLLLNSFLETHMILWGTFLTTENRVPTLWPITFTNILTLGIAALLLWETSIGMGAFACAPLIAGSLFNYWYWPKKGAKNLGCSWFRYMVTLRGRNSVQNEQAIPVNA
jgi:hypothetical protein